MIEADKLYERASKELDIKGVIDLEGNLICKGKKMLTSMS